MNKKARKSVVWWNGEYCKLKVVWGSQRRSSVIADSNECLCMCKATERLGRRCMRIRVRQPSTMLAHLQNEWSNAVMEQSLKQRISGVSGLSNWALLVRKCACVHVSGQCFNSDIKRKPIDTYFQVASVTFCQRGLWMPREPGAQRCHIGMACHHSRP